MSIDKLINEKRRVGCRCKEGCPWYLFASIDSRTNDFVVKNYHPVHSCDPTNKNKLCNSNVLAKYYNERIKEQPNIRIFKFQEIIRKELNLFVGRTVCGRAKKIVLKELMGDHELEFARILDYRDEMLRSNPGTTCVVKLSQETFEKGLKRFLGFYICFDAMKKAFKAGCRPCIGLDGCFLKGVAKGQLLTAVCKDGNNQMVPLAWAVVEVENKYTWRWFLKCIQHDLELHDGTNFTFITDMQKGLYEAMKEVVPNCEQRKCARHVLANWSKNWRGIEFRNCFWRCARSTFEAELTAAMDKMRNLGGKKCTDDLLYYNKESWSKVYFEYFSQCDSVDNNMAESFNAWILEARHKTIITMLDEIRVKMMKRIRQMREFVNTWPSDVSPMAAKVVKANSKRSMSCNLEWNGGPSFEVVEGDYKHIVNVSNRTCSCRAWMLKGIPCPHAIAALHHLRLDPINYISDWYSKETYMKTYSNLIQPALNMKMWPSKSQNPVVIPPAVRQMPGRPKKCRRKEATENRTGKMSRRGLEMTCGTCGQKGHNKRGCPKGRKEKYQTAATGGTSDAAATGVAVAATSVVATGNSAGQYAGTFSTANQSGRGRPKGSSSGATASKRPKIVGMGVLHTQSGIAIHNPGMPSRKIKSSAHVTGDIGHYPDAGVKWNGKKAMTSRQLQQLKEQKANQTRNKAAFLSQGSSTANS